MVDGDHAAARARSGGARRAPRSRPRDADDAARPPAATASRAPPPAAPQQRGAPGRLRALVRERRAARSRGRRLPALAALVRALGAHAAHAARRARRAARLRGRLRGGARARRPPDRLADARRVPPARAQPPVLAHAALPRPPATRSASAAARSCSSTSPAEGLQLHPLVDLQEGQPDARRLRARASPTATRPRCARLLDEMTAASRRCAAALHRLGVPVPLRRRRAALDERDGAGHRHPGARRVRRELLERARLPETARRALGAFETRPAARGAHRRPGAAGVHYLQYSFAPRLYIFNAFLQSLIGLYDYAKITGDERARTALRARPSPRRARRSRCPTWATGRATPTPATSPTSDYHELLREFLQSMCSRRLRPTSTATYAKRYRGYQTDPPVLELDGPELATRTSRRRSASTSRSSRPSRSRSPATARRRSTGSPPSAAAPARSPGRPRRRPSTREASRPRSCAPGVGLKDRGSDRDRGRARPGA